MNSAPRRLKPMNVIGLLFGLIIDVRWGNFMRIFSDVSWDSVGWWLIGILVGLFIFTSFYIAFEFVINRLVPIFRRLARMEDWAAEGASWGLIGAALHYLITLAMWHDPESLVLAWIHIVSFGCHMMQRRVKQLL
jgi:hypothetical protein